MMKKFAVLLAAAALLVLMVPGALAQDTFGLNADDYALFEAANANSAEFNSLGYSFVLAAAVSGVDGGPLTANLNGSGVIGVGADPVFSMLVDGQISEALGPIDAALELRLLGETVYVRLGEEWMGSTIDGLLGSFGAGMGMGGDDMGGMMDDPMSALPPEAMGALMGLSMLDTSEYVSISRADSDGVAVFTTSLDVLGLLSAPELAPVLGMAMAQGMGMGDAAMSPEELEQMSMMIGMLFSVANIELAQSINPNTQLIERTVLTLNLAIEGMTPEPITIDVTFDVALDYNAAVDVVAPEGVAVN